MIPTLAAALALATLALVAVSGPGTAQDADGVAPTATISVDGSSTLAPLTAAVAEAYAEVDPEVQVDVQASGTGRGFARFCAGETDIQDASRPMTAEEAAACADAGIDYLELEVARDGITLVVNENATFVNCMNLEALKLIWREDGPVRTWSELNPNWPAEPIAPYAPGPDSGTRDLFADLVLDGAGIRADALPAEDDAILVEGVANEENGIAFIGHAWYDDNRDSLNAIAVDGGAGCVEPSAKSIGSGAYAPLTRPLSLYVSAAALERPEVGEFLRFYIGEAPRAAADAGFVVAPADVLARAASALSAASDVAPPAAMPER